MRRRRTVESAGRKTYERMVSEEVSLIATDLAVAALDAHRDEDYGLAAKILRAPWDPLYLRDGLTPEEVASAFLDGAPGGQEVSA